MATNRSPKTSLLEKIEAHWKSVLIIAGVFTDWFLFAANCLRIVPPLTISEDEIALACKKIIEVLDAL